MAFLVLYAIVLTFVVVFHFSTPRKSKTAFSEGRSVSGRVQRSRAGPLNNDHDYDDTMNV
jgi:hypothetical protein